MSYFKKTIRIIIIVVNLKFATSQSIRGITKSIYDAGLNLDNAIFCNDYWFPKNLSEVRWKLSSDVFGQPFVKNNLIPLVEDHYLKPHSKDRDPLVLSFHGPPGVGKSFVADIISSGPFIKNKYIFSPHSDSNNFEEYMAKLNDVIDSSIRDCEKSIFVFDDAEYFPPGIIDKLNVFLYKTPYWKYGESVFIFIFQIASDEISLTTSQLLDRGLKREQFDIQGFRDVVKSVWVKSDVLVNNLFLRPLNKIIPFLPLEMEHIKKFIKTESAKVGFQPSENDIKKVFEAIEFHPGTLFTSSGCKMAKSKLGIILGRKTEL